MDDIDSRITMIQSRVDAARRARAKAEALKETAQESETRALAQLKDQFGVDNVTDARAKLAELQNELSTLLEQITVVLDTIEL